MSNPDWYYDQGSPAPEEEQPDVCSSCEYSNCQCDAAWDERNDR